MVPVLLLFKKGVMLDFKQAIPVLVDEEKEQIIFSISTLSSKFITGEGNKIELPEFSINSPMDVRRDGNSVEIRLK
jgi:hypothetical protein